MVGWATDSRLGLRSDTTGRGTSACGHSCGWVGEDSRHGKRCGSAGRGTSACVGIVVSGFAKTAGTEIEVAAQVEVQVHVWA